MRKIKRTSTPPFLLSDKVESAKKRLNEAFNNKDRQERLRFDSRITRELRGDLLEMCLNKCAYCESSINGATSDADIDNYRPKGGARGLDKEFSPHHYYWLAYEWGNLLITCQRCNRHKRNFFPVASDRVEIGTTGSALIEEKPLLIDPTIDDPDKHLEINDSAILNGVTEKGVITIDICKLNRKELVNERLKVGKLFLERLRMLESYEGGTSFNAFIEEINELFSEKPSQQYTMYLRFIFERWYKDKDNAFSWGQLSSKEIPRKWYRDIEFLIQISEGAVSSKEIKEQEEDLKELKSADSKRSKGQIRGLKKKLAELKRFTIQSIEIKNFKSLGDFSLNMLSNTNEDPDKSTSWLLILGDNGIGKSSVLQAVALALSSEKQIEKLELEVLDYLKRGKKKGFVKIHSLEYDEPIELHFDRKGFKTNLKEALTFILGYGSVRLLPKNNIQPDFNKEPYHNIRNLFDYSTALNDPKKWLGTLSKNDFDHKVAPAFFDILDLKEPDRVIVENRKVSIRHFGSEHELEHVSDGYKAVFALVADLMQTLSLDEVNYHNTQGIVLIDELGNHLHPRWKIKIVRALKNAFPNLQFIVSTHEPLCLRGLAHGEVVVMLRDQNQNVQKLDKSLLPDHSLMTIEQLLTSDSFGLIDVGDEEMVKTYEEYYALLSKNEEERTEEDQKKINEYSAKLSEKELLGSTPADQAVFEIANQVTVKIRRDGFKTEKTLKDETVSQIKNLIEDKKIDWL